MLTPLTNFQEQVTNAKGVVVLKLFATWCGPCKMLAPVMEHILEANPNLPIFELNVDTDQALVSKLGVSSIPVVIFFKDGAEVNRLVGLQLQAKYQELINSLVETSPKD
jgi:thioredoxin 1